MRFRANKYLSYILPIFIWIIAQPALAQKTWTGGGDGTSWFNESNWSPIGVPTLNDVVSIDDPNAFIAVNPTSSLDTAFAKALHIDNMLKFAIHGDRVLFLKTQGNENISLHVKAGVFSIDGDLYIKGATVDGVKLEGNTSAGIAIGGSLHILDFANFANGKGIHVTAGCIIDNKGHLSIRGGGLRSKDGIVSNGVVNNSGLLEIDNLQGNNIYYGIENYYLLINSGTIAIDSITNSAGIHSTSDTAVIENYGTITTTEILNPARPGINVVNHSTLRGTGIINAHLVNISQTGTTIQPDLGASSLTINGDLFFGIDANWRLRIAGIDGPNSLSGHAQLILNGDLTLEDDAVNGPTLHEGLENSFVPNELDNFSFIEFSGSKDGDFSPFIEPPGSLSGWGVFEMPGELVYRKACASTNSIATCSGPSCPLWTGTISGDGSVVMNGSFEVQSGEQFDIQFPETELTGGFTVELGTVFNVTPAACSF